MKKYIKLFFAVTLVTALSSCLKDKEYDNNVIGHNVDGVGVPKVIELAIASSPSHDKSLAIDFVDKPVTLDFLTVRLAAAEVAAEDITVTIDTTGALAAFTAYNAANGKNIVPLPKAFFTIVGGSLNVVIKKGTRESNLQITTNAKDFDPSTTYGLVFKITKVDKSGYNISGNFGSWMTFIGAKNSFDGVYSCQFTNYHPTSNPGYTGTTQVVHMVTTGPNSCKIFWPLADAFCAPAVLGGALNYFGLQEPEYTVNPSNNVVTVQNAYPGAVTFYEMAAGFNSRYDPATRTIYAKWGYNYSPGQIFNPAANREWTQTMTYTGPR